MSDVIVTPSDDSNHELHEVAEAIEAAQEQEQSFDIGLLIGRVDAIEEKVNYHDALISLHSHDGLSTSADSSALVMETEDRLVAKMQSLVDRAEDVIEENDESEEEESAESNEPNGNPNGNGEEAAETIEETVDEPPRSRAKRRGFAERYYHSSRL